MTPRPLHHSHDDDDGPEEAASILCRRDPLPAAFPAHDHDDDDHDKEGCIAQHAAQYHESSSVPSLPPPLPCVVDSPTPTSALPASTAITTPAASDDSMEMVNWRGQALSATHQLGGSCPSFFILGVVVFGYFAFGGVFFNLVIYFTRIWKQGNAVAANNSTNLVGTVYCTCVFGAILGDTYFGRILAVATCLIIYAMGATISAVGVTLKDKNPDIAIAEVLLMGGLYVMALGCGSYQPVLVALGGDQFYYHPSKKPRFFNWVFVASNIGVMLSLTILTYIEDLGRWTLSFWISTSSIGISILIFMIGIPHMQQARLAGNPLVSILKVLFNAIAKLHMKVDKEWLDKATIVMKEDFGKVGMPNSWRHCTRMQVEETKCVMRIIPFILIGVMYNVASAQLVSFFVVQGDTMDNFVLGFNVPPGSMRLFTNLAGIMFPPFYEYVIVPLTTRNGEGLSQLRRMGWGLLFGAFAMAIAAGLEKERLQSTVKISILWLIPQFTVMGVSNSILIVSQMDFFYSELPLRMRSLGSSLFLLCMGLGNYGSSLLVIIVTYVSSLHHSNWIPHQINEGHLDYFYWLLFAWLLLTIFLFLIISHFYSSPYKHTQAMSSVNKSSILHEDSVSS
ncbi:hypothetical protein L7F22_007927 [Adiantum nelumboides]|nr:hypothetical protein [Adiantum nelumboides]